MRSALRYITSLDGRARGAEITLDGVVYEVLECAKQRSGLYLLTVRIKA